jgi:tetratricopeptide (TPR) repeat protein
MRRVRRGALVQLVLWALCAACSLGSGCSSDSRPAPTGLGEGAEWVEQVRSAHARADAALAGGDLQAARSALRRATDAAVPAEIQPTHRRAVQQDLWFRLAEVALSAQQHAQALQAVEQGLALGRDTDVFTANLWIARGETLQALGRDTEAASSYFEALTINQRLLAELLREPAGPAP